MSRRYLLLSTLALAACGRVQPRQRQPTLLPARPAEMDRWLQEARGILSDVLESLRTFDTFQAFRASTAPNTSTRLPSELMWDPPTSAAWDEATHVTRGVHGRAEQLFNAVTTTRLDASLWRQQREAADATHELLDLSEALAAYRDRIDALPPGDAASALGLLDRAWARWETTAARWGVARAELVGCAA